MKKFSLARITSDEAKDFEPRQSSHKNVHINMVAEELGHTSGKGAAPKSLSLTAIGSHLNKDVCFQNDCPVDCKSLLEAQNRAGTSRGRKKSYFKSCYAVRSKSREENRSMTPTKKKKAYCAKLQKKKSGDSQKEPKRQKICYGKKKLCQDKSSKESSEDQKGSEKRKKGYYKCKGKKSKSKTKICQSISKSKICKSISKSKCSSSKCTSKCYGRRKTPPAKLPTPPTSAATIPSHETMPSSTVPATVESSSSSEEMVTTTSYSRIPSSESTSPDTKVIFPPVADDLEPSSKLDGSCMLAGLPGSFLCDKDFRFPPNRERMSFCHHRGPIPPCLQPVGGPCRGRLCAAARAGARHQVCGVKYANVKITFFPEYTTYEVMRSTTKKPKCMPACVEDVFVTKYDTGPSSSPS